MKLIILKLDGDVSNISFDEKDIEHFTRTVTGTIYDKCRNNAVIEIFDINLNKTIPFQLIKDKVGKEEVSRFKVDYMQILQDLGQEIDND
jgi:metal-dependent HD superfamily phosphatase/phosphodiesterase